MSLLRAVHLRLGLACLLAVLFAYLLPGVSMTLAWGVEAAAIIVLALAIGERSFRLSAIGLLLACVVKGLAYDVWHFDNTLARIVTLIAIGLILLSVSFIYGRYREKIHKLL